MIAELCIATALRHNKTVLKNCYCTPPFKVLDITEDRREETLHLMLMNASPGVLDGDVYNMQICIEAGCALHLHTQSYQRLFQMKGSASQRLQLQMAGGSSFYYLPHPSVPHATSNFSALTEIHLLKNCTLIWGEVLTCGRKGSGEQFSFSKYHSRTEIFLNGQLILKENLLLQPSLFDVKGLGQLEGYTHQASFIYLNEAVSIKEITDKLHEMLLLQKDICFGITSLHANGLVIRLLGYKGEHLHGLLKKIANELTHSLMMQKNATIKNLSYAN